ncbi:unnamed protein product [Parnassius apollo]|uniref:(apollo) hypothetical protein n=1 Tax=Parnassius apollo TaxID=110799 RepID=A0A8S3WMY6_PARAO|nr:unnamed protein product [Parnassius apollo]
MHFEESCFNRTLDVTRLHDNVVPSSSLIISNKTSGAVLREKQNKPESTCSMELKLPDDNLIENVPVKIQQPSEKVKILTKKYDLLKRKVRSLNEKKKETGWKDCSLF